MKNPKILGRNEQFFVEIIHSVENWFMYLVPIPAPKCVFVSETKQKQF